MNLSRPKTTGHSSTRRTHRLAVLAAAGLAASQLFTAARAADQYFDSDGIGPVQGGSGIWDLTTPNWGDAPNATTLGPFQHFNVAHFGNAGGMVMHDADVTPNAMTATGGTWTFFNNPLNSLARLSPNAAMVFDVAPGAKMAFLSVVPGFDGVIRGGGTVDAHRGFFTNTPFIVENGTLRFANGPVDFSNNTQIQLGAQGVLDMSIWNDGFGSLSGAAGSIVRMGTIQNFGTVTGSQLTVGVDGTDTLFAGSLQGDGGQLFKAGAGTMTLSGVNTFKGRVGVQNGTLRIEGGQAIGDTADVFFSQGNTNIAAAVLDLGASERVGGLGAAIAGVNINGNGHTLTIGSDTTFIIQYTGTITGNGTRLIKVGTGIQQFSTGTTAHTYTGGVEIREGTLLVSNDNKLGAAGGPVTIDGGTLANLNTVSLTHDRPFTIGTNGGTIRVLNNSAAISYSNTANLTTTLPNTVAGGKLTKTGGGRLALNNAGNTFASLDIVEGAVTTNATSGTPLGTGSITTQGGEITITPANVAGDVSLTAASAANASLTYGPGTRLQLIRGSNTGTLTLTVGGIGAGPNSVLNQGPAGTLTVVPFGGVENLGNPASGARENLIVNGGVAVKNGIVSPSIVSWTSGTSSAGEYLTYDATNGFQLATYSSTDLATAGATDVVKHTSGPVTLAGPKTVYALNTNQAIDGAGALTVGDGTGPAGVILNLGAALNNTGGVQFNGSGAAIYVQNTADVPVAGPLSVTGNQGLTKIGLGTLTLNSPATYTGPTIIGEGTLATTVPNALPATTDLRFAGYNSVDGSNTNAVNARLNLRLNGNNQTVNSLASTNHLATVEIGTGGVFTVNQNSDTTFLGKFTGGGTLVKTGTGTLRINPLDANDNSAGIFASSYDKIRVSGGTVAFSSFTAMPALPAGVERVMDMFTLENGATLRWEGQALFTTTQSSVTTVNQRRGVVLGEGGGVIDVAGPYEIFIWHFAQNAIGPEMFSGPGGLTKTGPGFLRLGAGNLYEGKTRLLEGTIQMPNASALGVEPANFVADQLLIDNGAAIESNGSGIFFPNRGITIGAGGGMIKSNNGPWLINSKISGPGSIIRIGGGAASQTNANSVTLNGSNSTFNGITLVSATTFFNGDGSAGVGAIDIDPKGIVAFGKNEGPDSTLTNAINLGAGSTIDLRVTSDTSPVLDSIYNGTQTGTLTLSGKISGPGTLVKGLSQIDRYISIVGGTVGTPIDRPADGTVILSNSTNDFTGDFTVMFGTVVAAANNTLGSTAGGTTVFDPGTLAFANVNYTTPERVYIAGFGHQGLGALQARSGTSTFAGPVSIMKDAFIGAADGASLNLTGPVTGVANLTKVGPGRLTLSNANNALPGTTAIDQGTLEFAANHSIGRLEVRANTTAVVGGGDKVLKVRELFMNNFATPDAKVDLGAGRLAVDYPEAGPSPFQDIRSSIIAARSTNWEGNGITSSAIASRPGTAVGYGEASVVLGASGGNWGGVPVDGTTVLARYTLVGDATLDATVNFDDLARLAQNYNNLDGNRIWTDGDFTYDGVVNFDDLAGLAQNYNTSLPAAAELLAIGASPAFQEDLARAFAQVPEPGAISLLAIGAAAMAGRRRRRA